MRATLVIDNSDPHAPTITSVAPPRPT